MTWKPDTCECGLEYNGTNSPENFVKAIHLCAFHQNDADSSLVMSENITKNNTEGLIIQNFPALCDVDKKGNPILKEGVFQWSFDANRELVVEKTAFLNDKDIADILLLKEIAKTAAITTVSAAVALIPTKK